MRRIRKTDTKPEWAVRRIAHALGFRFRLHQRALPGCPDLTFPKYRKVVFVHGCFWHQHAGCRLARLPKSRPEYWIPKLRRNQSRDEGTFTELQRLGWQVLVIWECETKDSALLRNKISRFLAKTPQSASP